MSDSGATVLAAHASVERHDCNTRCERIATFVLTALLFVGTHAFAGTYTNVTVTQVLTIAGQSGASLCYYFTLARVTQADTCVPGNPWFAISTNANVGAKGQSSSVLTARVTGTPVSAVVTTGAADPDCGNGTVNSIQF
jgi:hypothetical protein